MIDPKKSMRNEYEPDYVSPPSETLTEMMDSEENAVIMTPSPAFWLARMLAYEQYMESEVRRLRAELSALTLLTGDARPLLRRVAYGTPFTDTLRKLAAELVDSINAAISEQAPYEPTHGYGPLLDENKKLCAKLCAVVVTLCRECHRKGQ